METSRKSSLTLAFLLAFFIISSDIIVNSEAESRVFPLGRCTKDSDCKQYCPKCVSCNCVSNTCFCENPPLAYNTPTF
ncbi:hypothetical protein PHAVU_005G017800 [Phaseolus vulgaris]|uniref:Uncharacterized protein n=1 Tax=Phaseolus vulgaris TaxID=3885 RepID=V7BW80_PHAVU|nr:hypothetical protein PHAVU_005G017800g [Phaseolus vulgaris]ESW20826.1 hypothetical protein PHAVU_005G017800g [Phaseolus vulgaris]